MRGVRARGESTFASQASGREGLAHRTGWSPSNLSPSITLPWGGFVIRGTFSSSFLNWS
jgi:hypothetical protein